MGADEGTAGAGASRARPRELVGVGLALALALAAGLAIQVASGADDRTYGDIAPLFDSRGIRPDAFPYVDRPLEYPVLIGYVMWAASWIADTGTAFLYANAVLLAGLAAATTILLVQRGGRRALLFAAAPTLALYSFHNWDLLPVAACVAGVVALSRDRPFAAGAVLAVGAWAKLYPGVVLAALVVVALARSDRRTAARLALSGAAVSVVANVPVLVASWDGWWHPVRFQGDREATWGSLWYHLIRLPGLDDLGLGGPGVANAVAFGALAVLVAFVLRRAVLDGLDAGAIAAAVTVVFLLTNKVFSPQYTLWIVPFFALVPLSVRLWAGLMASDVALYAVVFGDWYGGEKLELSLRADLVALVVVVRATVLVLVLRQCLRPTARDRGEDAPSGAFRARMTVMRAGVPTGR